MSLLFEILISYLMSLGGTATEILISYLVSLGGIAAGVHAFVAKKAIVSSSLGGNEFARMAVNDKSLEDKSMKDMKSMKEPLGGNPCPSQTLQVENLCILLNAFVLPWLAFVLFCLFVCILFWLDCPVCLSFCRLSESLSI